MNDLEQSILEQVKADHDYVVSLRRYFHQHPELAKEEFHTQKRIEEELDKIGVAHKRIAGTGVYAEIKGNLEGQQVIVLRADIDALPVQEISEAPYKSEVDGKMHACGHDAHDANLIGAARILVKNRDKFGGTIRLIWQPGEEIGYGGRLIAQSGCVDGASRCFGLHMSSAVPVGKVEFVPGPVNASVDQFKILIHGLGAHITQPQNGVDAAYIAAQIVIQAQALTAERVDPRESVLVGIGHVEAGQTYNVVAQEAVLEGTVRVYNPKTRAMIKEQMNRLVESVSALYGAASEVKWRDNTSALINDEQAAKEAQTTASSLFGEDSVITKALPSLGGDDMAEFILKVPGVYGFLGSRNESRPETMVAQHNCHYDIDEDSLIMGVALYAAYAIEYLQGMNRQ